MTAIDGLGAMKDEAEEQHVRLAWYERQLEPLLRDYIREFAEMMRGPSSGPAPVEAAARLVGRHIEKRYAKSA